MFYNYPEEFLFQVIEKGYFTIISPNNSRGIIEYKEEITGRKNRILEEVDDEYIRSLRKELIMEGKIGEL